MTGPDTWGTLNRREPFSVCFGYDRGTPVDRVFIDEFLARERRYLENGGAFIVPVPELKVITAADLPKAV